MAGRQKRAGRNRAPSQRQLRVGEELRHAISEVLSRGEIRDPAVEGEVVSVTEVRASPDLKQATVYVFPLGLHEAADTEAAEAVVDGLKRSAAFVRGRVARKVHLRHTPQFSFELDTSFNNASHIDDLLHRPEVARDIDHASGDAADES